MKIALLLLLLLFNFFADIQAQTRDGVHLFDLSYGAGAGNKETNQKTFYINKAGVGYSYARNKINYGFQYHFLFGNYNGEDLFAALRTSEGLLIASDGSLTDVSVFFRGNSFYASIGTFIPKGKSGFIAFNFCGGVMQNNLAIKSLGAELPFLSKETIKGYDQFSFGPSMKQEVRWTHLGLEKKINFYLELFVEEAFLKNMRKYNYFNHSIDEAMHFNFLFGIQAGWIIPVYSGNRDDEFFID